MSGRVIAIVQARMGSSRLPGKVLLDLEGDTMLGRVVNRTSRASALQDVVVATTIDASDDVIWSYCEEHKIRCIRGSQYDVLDRYHQAARTLGADAVVRITADCPLIDPDLIDLVVHTLLNSPQAESAHPSHFDPFAFDFVANRLPPPWRRTYPIGLDVEACTYAALERAWREARRPHEREHVLPFLYEGVKLAMVANCLSAGVSPRGFRVALLDNPSDLGNHRWTVDAPEDLAFVREVFRHFGGSSDFTWQDVLALVLAHPELSAINAGVSHNTLGDIDPRGTQHSET